MDTLVSIIIPMYNSDKYIRTSIESVIRQTKFELCECILVDDNSPDNSREIAEEYSSKFPDKVFVIGYKKNRCAGGARNYGIDHAKGKYILFLDADDWIDERFIEECTRVLTEKECDIIDTDYYNVRDENDLSPQYQNSMPLETTGRQDSKKRYQNIVSGGRIFTKLISRNLLINNNLRYPENLRFEDNGIGALISYPANNIGKVRKGLYYYRVGNSDSQTGSIYNKNSYLDRISVALYFYEKSKEMGALQECREAVSFRFVELYYASQLSIYIRGDFSLSNAELKKLYKDTIERFPGYTRNNYYKKYMPQNYKVYCFLNSISPSLLKLYKGIFKLALSARNLIRKVSFH